LTEQNANVAFTKKALIAGTIARLMCGKFNKTVFCYIVAPFGFFFIQSIAKASALASLEYSGDILLP